MILRRITNLQLTYMSITGVEEVRAVQIDWWRTWKKGTPGVTEICYGQKEWVKYSVMLQI